MKNGRPAASYSRKLNPSQQNYTILGMELLAIMKILKVYCSMLLSANITI